MTISLDISRRGFIVGAAAAGLTVGFRIPFGDEAAADTIPDEVNAWVVVKPDDTVVIRVARSDRNPAVRRQGDSSPHRRPACSCVTCSALSS